MPKCASHLQGVLLRCEVKTSFVQRCRRLCPTYKVFCQDMKKWESQSCVEALGSVLLARCFTETWRSKSQFFCREALDSVPHTKCFSETWWSESYRAVLRLWSVSHLRGVLLRREVKEREALYSVPHTRCFVKTRSSKSHRAVLRPWSMSHLRGVLLRREVKASCLQGGLRLCPTYKVFF